MMRPIKRALRPIVICMRCPGILVFMFNNGFAILHYERADFTKPIPQRYFSASGKKTLAEIKIFIKKMGYRAGMY